MTTLYQIKFLDLTLTLFLVLKQGRSTKLTTNIAIWPQVPIYMVLSNCKDIDSDTEETASMFILNVLLWLLPVI